MSLKRNKDVPQLVEKYKAKYPKVDRDLVRRLIRVENKEIFKNPSKLKQLDRYLKKEFDACNQSQNSPAKTHRIDDSILNSVYEKRLEAIRQENLSNPLLAYFDLLLFADTLPSHVKDRLSLELLIATVEIKKSGERRLLEEPAQAQERLKTTTSIMVLFLINRIPMLLNEEKLLALGLPSF